MTLAAYTGHEALTFSDYLDLDTGKTLHAEPGGTYDIAPAGGRAVMEVPEPWFTAVKGGGEDDDSGGEDQPDTDGEPSGEPAGDEDPETDVPQQF